MTPDKKRIEYIDLAKGICIILVVIHHVCQRFDVISSLEPLSTFRMPLYFVLSGLFFKKYNSFFSFLMRKVNKLLVPFFFFLITTSIVLPILLYRVGYNPEPVGKNLAWAWFTKGFIINGPIWFLLCLFFQNILFYGVTYLIKSNSYLLFMLLFCVGALGYYSQDIFQFRLPLYIDTAMTALPFFGMGFVIKNRTDWLNRNISWAATLLVPIISIFIIFMFGRYEDFWSNRYETSLLLLYLYGIIGVLSILIISKKIKRLPVISYFGRYSIIILCCHFVILDFLCPFIISKNYSILMSVIITFIVLVLSFFILIPFCRSYLPYFTAQKDLIILNSEK